MSMTTNDAISDADLQRTDPPDDMARPCIKCGFEGYDHLYDDDSDRWYCDGGDDEYEPDDRSPSEIAADIAEERSIRRGEERDE